METQKIEGISCGMSTRIDDVTSRQQALDDCIALRHVMSYVAARLGVRLSDLHRHFTVGLSEPDSSAQVHALLDD